MPLFENSEKAHVSRGAELADALIAAAASISGLSLWTINKKHYPMPGMRLFSPLS
jgi:predicted nucleic acid-binding protein